MRRGVQLAAHPTKKNPPVCAAALSPARCGQSGRVGAQIVVEAPRGDNPNVVHLTHGSRPSSRPLSDEALLGSAAASDSYDQP